MKKINDVTGIELTPSKHGKRCLGNGEHSEYECCCDECDYYLYCFPKHNEKSVIHRWLDYIRYFICVFLFF